MADDGDRMREIGERFDKLQRENAPEPDSPVRPAGGRLRALLKLTGLILALVVTFQLAFTLMSFNGEDFADARRTGQATVESCERRGPIGFTYGYWDECLVSIRWNDGVPERSRIDKPHLFHADEAGTTVEIGDNGYGRSGRAYSRPTFEPQPLLAAGGVILMIIAAVPAIIVVWVLWSLLRHTVTGPRRRR